MLDQLSQTSTRAKSVFTRGHTDEQRVEAAFLYHLGLSYRLGGEWQPLPLAVHEWYTALADLFEPEPGEHGTVVVDETKSSSIAVPGTTGASTISICRVSHAEKRGVIVRP
ncbi:hypothetical protein D8S78_10300 [Natrialba swarupiae]|nr:hypothetical protein [Natrialba swarupiae]